jgi:hypothetical protein
MDAASHAFDRKSIDAFLSGLGSRVFLLNNVHEDAPDAFQTRWTLSYLAGPLNRDQVQQLTAKGAPSQPADAASKPASGGGKPTTARRPVLPAGASEAFLPATPGGGALSYRPAAGRGPLHYVDKKSAIDAWQSVSLLAPSTGTRSAGMSAELPAMGSLLHRPWTERARRRAGRHQRQNPRVEEGAGAPTSASSALAAMRSTRSPRRGRRWPISNRG